MDSYGVHPSPRNVPDVVLDMLKKNNGVIMISFCPAMTHAEAESASIDHVVDHILYVANRIGFEHIGLGSDYDGMERSVIGVEDVAKYPNIVAKMLERGIERSDVEKVIGLNVIRVMEDVEKVANATSRTLPVLQDEVKQLWVNEFRAWCREQYPNAEHDRPRA
jgi:membrane dipeptidase